MKNIILSITVLFFSTYARATVTQGIETNGGDGIVAEFFETFDRVISNLNPSSLTADDKVMVKKLQEVRSQVSVSTEPELWLNGIEVDAINQPSAVPPRIVISQKSWQRLLYPQKQHLTIHEMLPVAGYYDRDYKASTQLINKAPIVFSSRKEIYLAFLSCKKDLLQRMNISDFERIGDLHPVISAVQGLCRAGVEAAIRVHWNLNECEKGKTPLSAHIEQRDLYLKVRGDLEDYNSLYSLISDHGGTTICQ